MLDALAPARRRLVLALLALVVVGVLVVAGVVVRGRITSAVDPVAQDQPGPVLLVPGYGGSTRALDILAAALTAAGRDATVVALSGDGTGDLAADARVLATAADDALARTGASSVDVVGYSAGGVVARLWVRDEGGAAQARRVLTLGSPHHGTEVAALGLQVAPSQCPEACRQLVPGSDLLRGLNAGDETPAGPQFVSVWTTVDQVVTPPDSASLAGAINLTLQGICADTDTAHGDLPTTALVAGIALAELGAGPAVTLDSGDCGALSS